MDPTGHWMGSEGAEAAVTGAGAGGGGTSSRPSKPGQPGYMGQEALAVELNRTPPRTLVRRSSPLAWIEDCEGLRERQGTQVWTINQHIEGVGHGNRLRFCRGNSASLLREGSLTNLEGEGARPVLGSGATTTSDQGRDDLRV